MGQLYAPSLVKGSKMRFARYRSAVAVYFFVSRARANTRWRGASQPTGCCPDEAFLAAPGGGW
jgi:hypothetical protein